MTDCTHYDFCKRHNLLTCKKSQCRDYTGKIIQKGLLYRCTCGFTDSIVETDDGKLVCMTCGAIATTPLYKGDC